MDQSLELEDGPTAARSDGPPAATGAPISIVVGAIVGTLLFASTTLLLLDVDLYWHLRAGQELLNGVRPDEVGSTWALAPDPRQWVSTQWLAEVALYVIHAAGSWPALVVYRTLTAALAVAILANSTLRGRPVVLAAFPFLVAAAAAISFSQERPNQATFIGAAALGPVLLRGLANTGLPRWWLVLPLTWVWANYHGGWVLVPATLGLVALGRILDHGARDAAARKALALTLASLVAGTLTPATTSSTLAVFRFSAATPGIQEWNRTVPLEGPGLLTLVMLGLISFGWARSTIPRSEAAATALLVLFSWAAVRNVAPALLILAPLVANRLCIAFPDIGNNPEPRWSVPLGVALASGMLVLGLATIPGREYLPVNDYPVELATEIGSLPGEQRVLNEYDVSGFVLFFADPGDKVGIDGRTDRYGAEYIESYIDMTNLNGDWAELLAELDPTVALLGKESALAHVLVAERGWKLIGRKGEWVLIQGPDVVD